MENQAATNAMKDAVTHYVDQARHDNPLAGPPPKLDLAASARAAQAQTQNFAQEQARLVEQGIHTRRGPDTGGHYYLGYSQDQLHQMVHDQADPSAVDRQGRSFTNLGNGLIDISEDMATTAASTEGLWQGEAARAAHEFTTSMASWHGSSGSGAVLAGNRVYEQQAALSQARAAMPPPVPQPTWEDLASAVKGGPFTAPTAVKNWFEQYYRSVSNHQEMARVAQQYDAALGGSSTMPAFTPPPTFSPGTTTSSTAATGGEPPTGPGTSAAPHPAGSRPDPGQANPPGTGTHAQNAAPFPTPAPQPGATPAPAGADPGMAIPVMGMPLGGINPGDSYRTGGGRPGAPGSPDGAEPGARSGAGAAAAERAAIDRGDAAGRAQPGMPAVGPLAGGRPAKGEDTEHQRASYLQEADPESVFGTDQRVAPPVIGEP